MAGFLLRCMRLLLPVAITAFAVTSLAYGQDNEVIAGTQKNSEASGAKIDRPLQAELRAVLEDDQKYRRRISYIEETYGRDSPQRRDLSNTIHQKDAENQAKVKAILDQRGWLGPDIVGDDGSMALFLVIQHDTDLKTQEKYLPMLREAVKGKKARGSQLALLEDRVALREGRRQTYGSQISFNQKTGKYYVESLDDPDNVDSRRATIGLRLLAEYVKQWNITWDVAEYKKQMPELEELEHPGA
jgi:hypothetical protein